MIDIENLQTEVQTRADALTAASPEKQIIEVGVAARSIELAGADFNRTLLDIAIQDAIDEVSGASTNAQLIALAAAIPRPAVSAATVEVGTYVTGLFKGNSKYLACNGGTYLRSAYPELTTDAISSLSQQISPSSVESTNITINNSYEGQSSIYKVGSKFYKLSGGTSNPSAWLHVPIQSSTDGIVFTPVVSPAMASPITSSSGTYQMDTLLVLGTTLLAFGRLTAGGSQYIIQLKSQDDGKNWVFSTLRNTTFAHTSFTNPVLAEAIGNTVVCHVRGEQANSVFYSSNFGTTWSTLTDSDVDTNTKFINGLAQDGTRFMVGFTDGSTAYSATDNPAGNTWTAVAPPNSNAKGTLAAIEGKWIMGGTAGYVATCTSLGTWVAETMCTSGMPLQNIERILVNGSTIAFSTIFSPAYVYYTSNTTTLPAAVAVSLDSVVTSPVKLNLASVADGNFYLRHGSTNIIRSTSLVPSSFTSVQSSFTLNGSGAFDSVNNGVIKKFDCYFYSVGALGQNKRFTSLDMKNWGLAPSKIATGCGAIVDAGTRLLALDDNQLLWQSTDGVTWDTTGITRPTLSGSVYSSAARLYVCANGWIYYVVFRNSDAQYYIFVSKNDGSTWDTVSGLSFAGSSSYSNVLQNPCLFKEIDGKIYTLSVNYFTSNYGYYLNVSTNGTVFSYLTGSSNSITSADYRRRNGIFKVDGAIYAFVAGDSNSAWLVSYDNGVNFYSVPQSFMPTAILAMSVPSSYLLNNYLSRDNYIYLRTSSPEKLVRLYGESLNSSANYLVGAEGAAPSFVYESETLKVLMPSVISTTQVPPKLLSLADTNTTFTLPNITNTWLRASS